VTPLRLTRAEYLALPDRSALEGLPRPGRYRDPSQPACVFTAVADGINWARYSWWACAWAEVDGASDMVERVARAIARAAAERQTRSAKSGWRPIDYDNFERLHWQTYQADAYAAITAMRYPTDAQILAMFQELERRPERYIEIHRDDLSAAYSAAIDGALK
jgi:hypothetical protein